MAAARWHLGGFGGPERLLLPHLAVRAVVRAQQRRVRAWHVDGVGHVADTTRARRALSHDLARSRAIPRDLAPESTSSPSLMTRIWSASSIVRSL